MKISKKLISDLKSIENDVQRLELEPQNADHIVKNITTKVTTAIAILSSVYENLCKLNKNKSYN